MKFIYTPVDGMSEKLTKYDIKFVSGETVEVTDLKKASKLQKIPYMSACLEVEEVKPKRKRRTPEEMEEARRLESTEKENASD